MFGATAATTTSSACAQCARQSSRVLSSSLTSSSSTSSSESSLLFSSLRNTHRHRQRNASSPSSSSSSKKGNVILTSAKLALIPSYSNLPHPAKTAKGGEDAWFIKPDVKGGGVIGVADGVGGFGDQGVDPGLYARVLAFECLCRGGLVCVVCRGWSIRGTLKHMIAGVQTNAKTCMVFYIYNRQM